MALSLWSVPHDGGPYDILELPVGILARDGPVLAMLCAAERRDLLRQGVERRYTNGQRIVSEGDTSLFLVVILSGWTVISVCTERGGRLILAVRGAQEIVGELSAIDGRPRSATVSSLGTTRTVIVPGDRLGPFLARHPGANLIFMRSLATRLRDADSQRRALVSLTVLQRLSELLCELADNDGTATADGVVIRPSLAQRDLAASIGATREGAAKALRVLREGGAIRTGQRRITVIRRDLLELLGGVSGTLMADL